MAFSDPLTIASVAYNRLPAPGEYIASTSSVDEPTYWKMATTVQGDRQRTRLGFEWHRNPVLPPGVTFNSQPGDVIQKCYLVMDIHRGYATAPSLAGFIAGISGFAVEANIQKLLQQQL